MVRPLRIELAGELYHVSSRDDQCDAIYPGDADDLATIRSGGPLNLDPAVDRFVLHAKL
jgi:hypothetical protein